VTRLRLRPTARVLLQESVPTCEAFPEDANAHLVSVGDAHFVMPLISGADPGSCSDTRIARRARVAQPGATSHRPRPRAGSRALRKRFEVDVSLDGADTRSARAKSGLFGPHVGNNTVR
jgi:hypothetical protein